jgi:hypothetical protein
MEPQFDEEGNVIPAETPVPQMSRKELYDYLMRRRDPSADIAIQERANQEQLQLGLLQAANTMGQAAVGSNRPVNDQPFEQMQANAGQRVKDYLMAKKAREDEAIQREQIAAKLIEKPAAPKIEIPQGFMGEENGQLVPLMPNPNGAGYISTITHQPVTKYRYKPMGEGEAGRLKNAEENTGIRRNQAELAVEKFGWSKDKNLIDRTSSMGKYLVNVNEPQFDSAKSRVLAKMSQFKDIPGYGRDASWFSNWIQTGEGQQFRSDIEKLVAPVRKGLYGSALTEHELVSFQTMSGTGKGFSEDSFRHAVETLIADKDREVGSVKARDPEAYKVYETQRSGGFVNAPAPVAAPQPAPATPKKTKIEMQKELDEINAALGIPK